MLKNKWQSVTERARNRIIFVRQKLALHSFVTSFICVFALCCSLSVHNTHQRMVQTMEKNKKSECARILSITRHLGCRLMKALPYAIVYVKRIVLVI